jgi:hypothetical protein
VVIRNDPSERNPDIWYSDKAHPTGLAIDAMVSLLSAFFSTYHL